MGSCLCKKKEEDGVTRENCPSPTRSMSLDLSETVAKRPRIMDSQPIELLILETLRYIGSYQESSQNTPAPSLVKINSMADTSEGWLNVVYALIRTVPLYDPLGPSTINMVLDDCPLPARETVLRFTRRMDLCKERCPEAYEDDCCVRRERNLLVVLGCIADKFAGPNSVEIMTGDVVLYLGTFLMDEREPNLVLHALITLEKFGRTAENKVTIDRFFRSQFLHPLLPLEIYHNARILLWRQVGFCARWALDNTYVVPGRRPTYQTVNMDDIQTVLNAADVSENLKISPDGLEARCDSQSFESVRGTFRINSGCWYYEAEIVTAGVMQIGWATKNTSFQNHEGYGVGDDAFSMAYDGCRRLIWHKATATPQTCVQTWQPGDIVGCLIDVELQEAIFSLNGVRLPTRSDIFTSTREGFYAAASFMAHQQCRFNFGSQRFFYAPMDRDYNVMNAFGLLTLKEKQVIPRRIQLAEIHIDDREIDNICTICFDDVGNYGVDPCGHGGFCLKCVQRLDICPLCRCLARDIYILAL